MMQMRCPYCRTWVKGNGIDGAMKKMAEHLNEKHPEGK